MGFSEQHALATDEEFIKRVKMAMVKSAIYIANEDTATAGHAQRAQYAQAALANPESAARNMAYGVASNAVISAESSDSDIEFTINSVWNAYAGVITKAE